MTKEKLYEVVSVSQLIQNVKTEYNGAPRVIAALETIDKKIVTTIERKGETYFILEA